MPELWRPSILITRALAQNLVAIGMADLIVRTYKVADTCCYKGQECAVIGPYTVIPKNQGCCQEQNIDTYGNILQIFGVDIYDGE